jgi:nitrogen-specific signal transduction histidine kinase/PAS domain-containing protein
METNDLKKIDDLNKFLSIIIVDDNPKYLRSMKLTLQQDGYKNIQTFMNSNIPEENLKNANILLTDYNLNNYKNNSLQNKRIIEKNNGIDLIKNVKNLYGDKIETILFTGEKNDFVNIEKEASDAKVSVVFKKPFEIGYIKIWINELGKRIWLQQILDYDPDEVIIRSKTGTILYADEEKERIFGKDIIGKKCYDIFENRGLQNKICEGCPGEVVLKENKPIRREWEYVTRGEKKEHRIHQSEQYLDINVAPLKDKIGNNLGLIEISRDITLQKILNNTIQEMELVDSFNRRIEIFLSVFKKLNYKRVRLYFEKDDFKKFKLVKSYGHIKDLDPIEFYLSDDKPSFLIDESKKSLLFSRDFDNDDLDYTKSTISDDLYKVGKNKIFEYDKLSKDSWFDIPLFSNGKLIGKVSIDGWKSESDIPDHYDLNIFTEFGKLAGQVIENAKQKDIIKRKEETNKAILELSKEITNISKRNDLLNNTLELIGKTLDVEMCSIFIFDDTTNILSMKKRWIKEYNNPLELENYYFNSECITMKAYLEGKSKFENKFNEMVNSARINKSIDYINIPFVELYEKILNGTLRNCIFSPLNVGDKKIGLLRAMNKNRKDYFGENDFDVYDLEEFELLAGQVAVAIYNMKQYEKLDYESDLAKQFHQKAEETLKEKETESKAHIEILGLVLHNIKTPLATTQYSLERLNIQIEKDGINNPKIKEYIIEIKNSLNEISKVNNAVRKLKNPWQTRMEKVNIQELLEEISKSIVFSKLDIYPEYEIQNNINDVYIDYSAFKLCIEVVLQNSVDALINFEIPEKKIKIVLRESTSLDFNGFKILKSNYLSVDIINNGPKIPEHIRNGLFIKMQSDKIEGAGIGLLHCKTILSASLGNIYHNAESEEETKFTIVLPYKNNNYENFNN